MRCWHSSVFEQLGDHDDVRVWWFVRGRLAARRVQDKSALHQTAELDESDDVGPRLDVVRYVEGGGGILRASEKSAT